MTNLLLFYLVAQSLKLEPLFCLFFFNTNLGLCQLHLSTNEGQREQTLWLTYRGKLKNKKMWEREIVIFFCKEGGNVILCKNVKQRLFNNIPSN